MAQLPTIGMLWVEGPLSFLEVLCVKSFLDAGHPVEFYHYGEVQNVPAGAILKDANEILSGRSIVTHTRTGSPAPHADAFRYRMLAKRPGIIWADTDAYCLKPFLHVEGHYFGWESSSHINNGVVSLPPKSAALKLLIEHTEDPCSIPLWYGEDYAQTLREARDRGEPLTAGDQPWGVWGPHALTHFLHVTGEYRYALPREVLFPIMFRDRRRIAKPNTGIEEEITSRTCSIHLYGRRMRRFVAQKFNGEPPKDGLLGRLLARHHVDPRAFPLPSDTFVVRDTEAKERDGPSVRFTLAPALRAFADNQ